MPNKLTILNNKQSQFLTEDTCLFNSLRYLLSYKQEGYEYSRAYQNGWDGTTFLINKKGIFSTGLIDRVRNFLKEKNITFEEEDRKVPLFIEQEIDLSNKLKELNMVPREHQERMVAAAFQVDKGIIRSCTGSGKTNAIALLVAKINKPTLILVIGLDLLQQFHDLLSQLFDEPIGFIGNGICNIHRINVATIQTIGRSLRLDKKQLIFDDEGDDEETFDDSQNESILQMLQASKVLILDECHTATTATLGHIYKQANPERIYGFSGTPFRGTSSDIITNSILGEQIINISASELINKGLLAQPIIRFIPVSKKRFTKGTTYSTIYKDYVVENDERNELIIKHTISLISKGYTPLILFKQIKHGDILFKQMQNAGIGCELLNGNDSLERREEVKAMINDNKIKAILASVIFDIGINIPKLSALILAGGGRSYVKILQRAGRILRVLPGKKQVAILEFYDQCKYLREHAEIRYSVYASEEGFILHPCQEMKD